MPKPKRSIPSLDTRLKKAIEFGVIKGVPMPTKRKRKRNMVVKEIRTMQKGERYAIPQAPMKRLIKEIVNEVALVNKDMRIQDGAKVILQMITEQHLGEAMQLANRLTAHRDKVTLMPKDLNFALRVLDDMYNGKTIAPGGLLQTPQKGDYMSVARRRS